MDQAEEEAIALERFRELSGELPGDVVRGADPPDFVVTDAGRRTAVEMIRYHQDAGPTGSAGAKQESLERRVMALAETLFGAANPGVHVRRRRSEVSTAIPVRIQADPESPHRASPDPQLDIES